MVHHIHGVIEERAGVLYLPNTTITIVGVLLHVYTRVGLVRTDASCVRPMGYLAIYFCVLSSVLLASFEVLPLRRTQVGRKSWVLRPTCVLRILRRNPDR